MNITLNNPTFNFQAAPPMAGAFFAALMRSNDDDIPVAPQDVAGRPQIGEYWHGQGGIYAGNFRSDGGSIYGLIVAQEQDIGIATWGQNSNRNELSDWDGAENTKVLLDVCPAAKLAARYTRDGHTDFYLPARRELLLGAANLHDTFGTESRYWTSTPYSSDYVKVFDFEHGFCLNRYHRLNEFRVRPFRKFIY